MLDLNKEDETPAAGWFLSRDRIKTILVGCGAALVLGLALLFAYSYFQYGVSPIEMFTGKTARNPNAGKLAYDLNTNTFIGVIKSEEYSTRRRAEVFYIERAGGQLIELPKTLVAVRERAKQ